MDQRTESLKQEIDETRGSMTDKMEQIESQVQGTVDHIKDSATNTVQQVKQKLDLRRMVEERPWTMVGASVLTGFVLGSMGGSDKGYSAYSRDYPSASYEQYDRGSRRQYRSYDEDRYYEDHPTQVNASNEHRRMQEPAYRVAEYSARPRPRYADEGDYGNGQSRASSGSGIVANVQNQFGDELTALKRAAIATATDTLRSLLRENVPQFAEEFERARHERERQHGDSEEQRSAQHRDESERQTYQQTEQTSETPTSIVAPAGNGEADKTFKTTQQTGTTSSSINAPAEQQQR